MDDLPGGRFGLLDHGGDFRITDIEHVVQEKGGSLLGRKSFEQREERYREIVGEIEVTIRRRVGHDRLRQPLADVRLTFGLEPSQPVDCQPSRSW